MFFFGSKNLIPKTPKNQSELEVLQENSDVQKTGETFFQKVSKLDSEEVLLKKNEKIQKKFEYYKAHPKVVQRNIALLSGGAALITAIMLGVPILRALVFTGDDSSGEILALPFVPLITYIFRIKKIQIDMVKRSLADKYGWKYDPSESKEKWEACCELVPDIFKKGNNNTKNIQDQFLGTYREVPFYSSIFHYQIVRGSGKNRRTENHHHTLFVLQLPRKVKNYLSIAPETTGSKILNKFSKHDIETESTEFNKTFRVLYKGEKSENELELVSKLTPSIQTRMIDLYKESKGLQFYCADDMAIFMFKGRIFSKMKTSFIKNGVKIDKRDEKFLEERLNESLEITAEVLPFLK